MDEQGKHLWKQNGYLMNFQDGTSLQCFSPHVFVKALSSLMSTSPTDNKQRICIFPFAQNCLVSVACHVLRKMLSISHTHVRFRKKGGFISCCITFRIKWRSKQKNKQKPNGDTDDQCVFSKIYKIELKKRNPFNCVEIKSTGHIYSFFFESLPIILPHFLNWMK